MRKECDKDSGVNSEGQQGSSAGLHIKGNVNASLFPPKIDIKLNLERDGNEKSLKCSLL